MRRRQFLRMMSAGAVAAASSVSRLLPGAFAVEAAKRKLNVLFVAVDDLRPELGCFGHPTIQSPHIDKLAAQGTAFLRAYVQQAVCAPSRASLLTGTRPDTTRIYDLKTPVRRRMPKVLTLPQHFRNCGYETVSLGKIYHHHSDDNGIGWSIPAWHPSGPWKGRQYRSEESIAAMRERDKAHPNRKGIGPAFEAADVPDNGYPDGVTADKAIEELRRLKAAGTPFFLAVGFYKPHLPFNAPKRYWDLYDRAKIQVPANRSWPKGMPPMAGTNWGELRQYTGIPRQGNLPDSQARELIHGYHACVSYMDAQVGRVVAELGRLGLRDNTIIVLWGDHGWKLGEYSAWCKHTNFELDTHAPVVLSVPLPLPDHLEGTSMMPLLDDPDRPWKKAAISQYPRGKLMGYTLRTDRWRYTEWRDRKTRKAAARELYDHEADPGENVNVASRRENRATVAGLAKMLAAGWKAARPS